MAATTSKASLNQLNDLFEEYLVKKAPALPTNVKEAIVNFAPWISLIVLLISLPAILAFLGIGAFLMPFSFLGGAQAGASFALSTIILIVTVALEALAIPGLFKRTQGAWNLLYWATLIHAVYSLVTFQWVNLILGTLISLYFLFQVKDYYKA